jgi:hypothetical protein
MVSCSIAGIIGQAVVARNLAVKVAAIRIAPHAVRNTPGEKTAWA